MNIISVIGIGVVAAALSIILRQYKPEFSLYISLAAGVIIIAGVIAAIKPLLSLMTELTGALRLGSAYGEALLKALAVCYLTKLAADACIDAGERAIAAKLETAGKIAIMLISLPLFREIVSVITRLIQ